MKKIYINLIALNINKRFTPNVTRLSEDNNRSGRNYQVIKKYMRLNNTVKRQH